MSWSTIGSLLVIIAGFAVCAMAFGFFKAAWTQKKADKEAGKQKLAEEAKEAEKKETDKISKSKNKNQKKNKPKVKRLDKK